LSNVMYFFNVMQLLSLSVLITAYLSTDAKAPTVKNNIEMTNFMMDEFFDITIMRVGCRMIQMCFAESVCRTCSIGRTYD
jgi:hypothetical protein